MSVAEAPNVFTVIGGMEEDVRDLVAWANAIAALGCHHGPLQPETIFVMGKAMLMVAQRIQNDWRDLHHLAAVSIPAEGRP